MSTEGHRWHELAQKLRRAMGLCPPTPAEADKAMREAAEVPMSEQEILGLVREVTKSGALPPTFHPEDAWSDGIDTHSVAEDSRLVMNRNPGEEDEEVDREIEELRREALEDDEADDQA